MAEIERPIFSEGEILRAQDLNTAIDQSRLREARHARQQHRWGIVQGLNLQAKAGELTIDPGVAIDFRGREILVPLKERISPQAFPFNGMARKDDLFPVFLIAVDEELTADAFVSRCGGATGQSKRDSYEILIQRYREAQEWELPEQALLVTDGPDPIPGQIRLPRVLLGFVKWDVENERFSEELVLDDALYPRRFAGPRGNVWESQDAAVQVFLGPTPKGAQDALTLQVTKAGKPQRLAHFDLDGNLYITGQLRLETSGQTTTPTEPTTPPPTTGDGTRIVSGVATDGMKLPLPTGVTDANLKDYFLHTFVRHIDFPSEFGVSVIECRVDEDRRVRCLIRELFAGTTNVDTGSSTGLGLMAPRASSVEYLVVASPKPSQS